MKTSAADLSFADYLSNQFGPKSKCQSSSGSKLIDNKLMVFLKEFWEILNTNFEEKTDEWIPDLCYTISLITHLSL